MKTFFVLLLCALILFFLFIQVRGLVKDIKKRKKLKEKTAEKMRAQEAEKTASNEELDHVEEDTNKSSR